jgi:uncharacterized membrane protein YuzA (DUF378 family)
MNRPLDVAALILVIVGALNWGLVGLFEFDLVAEIVGEEFGTVNVVSRIVYILVAVAGLYLVTLLSRVSRPAGELNRSYS